MSFLEVSKRRWFECPYCKEELKYDIKFVGKEIRCPECRKTYEAIAVKEPHSELLAMVVVSALHFIFILLLLGFIASMAFLVIVKNISSKQNESPQKTQKIRYVEPADQKF